MQVEDKSKLRPGDVIWFYRLWNWRVSFWDSNRR